MAQPGPEITPLASQVTDNHAGATTTPDGDIHAHLLKEYLVATGQETTEQGAASDKVGGGGGGTDQVQVQPNQLISQAQSAAKEMVSLLQNGASPSEVIQYTDAQGQVHESTVGDMVNQLKDQINQDCQQAISASNTIDQSSVSKQLDANAKQLEPLAQQMGLNVNDPQFDQEVAQLGQQYPGNQQVTQLAQLAQQRDMLNSERMLPATAIFAYAMLKADGLTDDPVTSIQSMLTTGQPKPTNTELADSYMMINQAGRLSPEAQNSPLFQQTLQAVSGQYEQNQSQSGQQIVQELAQAKQLEAAGQTSQAEQLYQQAYQVGQGIDQKFIAAQLKLPANQNNPQVAQALIGILSDVKDARLDYANFLNKQGKFSEALPIALQVAADTPEFAQQDPSFNQIVSKATFGNAPTAGDLAAKQQKFAQLMQSKDYSEASKELDSMKSDYQKTKTQLQQDDTSLDQQTQSIATQLTNLQKQQSAMDPTEYKIEQQRLQDEQTVLKQSETQNQSVISQGAYLDYLSGVVAYCQGDNKTAYASFNSAKNADPDLEKNSSLNLDKLISATKPEGWWERNWKAVATVGAVVAGVAVGAVSFGIGGVATTAGLLATIGAAGVAGGAAYSTIKGASIGFNNVGWKDFATGAFTGALSATPFAGGALLGGAGGAAALGTDTAVTGGAVATDAGLTGGAVATDAGLTGGAVATDTAVTGGSVAATTGEVGTASTGSWLGTTASNVLSKGVSWANAAGITGRTLAVGAGLSGTQQAYNVAFNGESWGDAAKGFALGTVIDASTMGMGAKFLGGLGVGGAATGSSLWSQSVNFLGFAGGSGLVASGIGIGADAYQQHFSKPLNLDNPQQAAQFGQNWDQINPDLFAAPQVTPGSGESSGEQSQPAVKPLTQAQIQALQNQPIQDEPIGGS